MLQDEMLVSNSSCVEHIGIERGESCLWSEIIVMCETIDYIFSLAEELYCRRDSSTGMQSLLLDCDRKHLVMMIFML